MCADHPVNLSLPDPPASRVEPFANGSPARVLRTRAAYRGWVTPDVDLAKPVKYRRIPWATFPPYARN